ncbi:MAG: hypothetical protein AB7U73_11370 [Pirellulales bacterium]
MIAIYICLAAIAQPAIDSPTSGPTRIEAAALTFAVPRRVQLYLERCETARQSQLEALEQKIEQQEKLVAGNEKAATGELDALRKRCQLLRDEPAPLLSMPLPARKEDIGVLPAASFADPQLPQSVDVLEVVDDDDLIVRAWYALPTGDGAGLPGGDPRHAGDGERTFVDLWIRGVDTTEATVGHPITLPQAFLVTGDQTFDTDCGKRLLPRLEPIEVERFRSTGRVPER